jgi:hypothetical protein
VKKHSKLTLKLQTIRTLVATRLALVQGGLTIDGTGRDWTCDVCGPSMPSVCPL